MTICIPRPFTAEYAILSLILIFVPPKRRGPDSPSPVRADWAWSARQARGGGGACDLAAAGAPGTRTSTECVAPACLPGRTASDPSRRSRGLMLCPRRI